MPQSENSADKYLDFVRQYLDFPLLKITGTHLKVFSALGDSVSVFVLKALYPSLTVDELMLKKILKAISAAFQYRNAAGNATDRIPAVSLCLLEMLLAGPYSPEQKDSIRAVIERLRKETIAGATTICPCSG